MWNAGIRFGVYLTFSTLVEYLRTHHAGLSMIRTLNRMLVITGCAACALAAIGAVLQRHMPEPARPVTASASAPASKPSDLLASLAAQVDASMKSSRPVLLGSRNPAGQSCVSVVKHGDVREAVPTNPGDWNGGPGTTMATLYYFDRQSNKSPMQDFVWHQNRLKTYLENEAASNRSAEEIAHELSTEARHFRELMESWTALPTDLNPTGFSRDADWPGYCMTALDRAIASRDLPKAKHWAGELEAAAFSLDDLHHWLGFLVENHLTALEFQNRCETLFAAAEQLNRPYDPQATVSQFPAGVLSLNGMSNYYEVERQGERLFTMPADRIDEITLNEHLTPGSMWVVPGARKTFLEIESVLSSDNKKTWEEAARTPYQHSYLINMLYRSASAGTEDEMCAALRKFDALTPHATMGELLGMLMYRGHSFAGLEWDDRFQPQLVQAADDIKQTESDSDALLDACRWTNRFYNAPATYGVTLTLRDALEQKKLDCVRATDMIGAIFRNAGRTRFGHVRWCAESAGHSVAVYFGMEKDKLEPLIVDGLNTPAKPDVWPDCYFHGHTWPPGMTENPTPYAVELYARGIDSYVWLEGYIVRGPNAGQLSTAGIPYSQAHQRRETRKVFEGPYPE
jgi:hypothetical protein